MALVSLTCPQCGAALELEAADHDFGFCNYCGCKVQLHEIVSVKHSGSVTLDNSAQATNRVQIANRAFESHNFTEASSYYTKVLEDFPGNYTAIYRKGICAVYLSTPINLPTREFEVAMKHAYKALQTSEQLNGKAGVDLIAEKDHDILELLNSCILTYTPGSQIQSSLDSCNTCYSIFVGHAAFAATAVSYIDSEAVKEPALANSIDFCKRAERTRIRYHAGTTVGKKGDVKENIENSRISDSDKNALYKTKTLLSGLYNSLPSRLEREGNLNASIKLLGDDVHGLEKQIASEKQALRALKSAFWKANPVFAQGRKKALLPAFIIGGIFAIATLFFYFFDVTLGFFLAPAGVLLAILLGFKMEKKYENSVFTDDIKSQVSAIEEDLKILKEKKENLENENGQLREFNRSKK